MPQELNILCCYSCKRFQVHIVKKAKKWRCVICNEKQSVQKVYFQGSGRDCRLNVQKLNSLSHSQTIFKEEVNADYSDNCESNSTVSNTTFQSKWSKYLETPRDSAQAESDVPSVSYDKDDSNDHLKRTLSQNTNITETLVTFGNDDYTVNKNLTYDKTIEKNTLETNSITYNDSFNSAHTVPIKKTHVEDSTCDLSVQFKAKTTETESIFESHDDIDVSLDF